MGHVGAADVRHLVERLPDLYALGPVERFPARALRTARSLVSAESASFNEIDLRTGAFKVLVDPVPDEWDERNEAFERYAHQHPVISHVRVTHDPAALAISDFMRPVEFRRTPLYGELYGPIGAEDQLSTTFTLASAEVIVAVALHRGAVFEDRDRTMLDALRPHLAAGYSNAVAYSAVLRTPRDGAEQSEQARARLGRLTDRQFELLGLIASGCTNAEAARALDLRVGTVKKHVEHIFDRLGTGSRLAAARVYLSASDPSPIANWWAVEGVARVG